MNPKRSQPARPTGSPTKPRSSEIFTDIVAHQVPAIILTQPTPPSSVERMPPQTLHQPAFQTPPRPLLPYQSPPRPLLPYQSPPRPLLEYQTQTPPSTPPLRTVPRATEDVQGMLDAMAGGRFDGPVFGAAGVAFHRDEDETGKKAPVTRKKALLTSTPWRKVKGEGDEGMGELLTPTSGVKRKRKMKMEREEEDGVQKKPKVARKKAKVE